jgi:hypothetical protein
MPLDDGERRRRRERLEREAAHRFIERMRTGPGKGCACHGCIAKRDSLAIYDRAMKEARDA